MTDGSEATALSDIVRLENAVVELRRQMTEVMPRRPIVIEFCGSPRSGKTQSINSLSVFLRRNQFRVHTIVEQAAINPIPNKFDPSFNVWNGCNSLCKLLEAITNRATENDFILMDRGVFDTVCWFNFQMQRGAMPKEEYEAFTNFFLNEKWVSIVTLVYVFFARPDVSLKREYATLLTRKPGSVMRDEILRDYNSAIDNCVDEHGALFPRVARLDTSDKNQDQVGYLVTSQVIDILDDVLQEKIGYFETLKIPSLGKSIFEYKSFAKSLPELHFDRRILVEADAVAAQPVAIAVIKDRNEDKVLIGTKTSKTLRSNSPERNRTLFWFGGHVRGEDARSASSDGALDVEETLREALRREIKEELDLDLAVTTKPRICVWDHSSEFWAQTYCVYFCDRTGL